MTVGAITGGTLHLPANPTPTGEAAPAAAARLDPQRLQGLLDGIAAAATAKEGGGAPVGAPALPPPEMHFSAEDAALILGSLQNKQTEGQLKLAKEGVTLDAQKKQELHKQAMQKLEDAAAKTQEAKTWGIVAKVIGMIGKAVAIGAGALLIAGGVALSIGSVGIGVPLGIAMALMGGVMMGAAAADLAMDVASCISQALGGPDISIMALLTKGLTEGLKAAGVPEEYVGMVATGIIIAGQVAIAAVAVAVALTMTVLSLGVAAPVGFAAVVAIVASIMGTGASLVGAQASIAGGAVSIGTGVVNHQADSARADKMEIDSFITQLQQKLMEEQDRIKELVTSLDEAMTRISSMISSSGDTRIQIARNMV